MAYKHGKRNFIVGLSGLGIDRLARQRSNHFPQKKECSMSGLISLYGSLSGTINRWSAIEQSDIGYFLAQADKVIV